MARHLITSALPYINGIKHLGNMVGSMLPADVYSRYLRQRGHEVLYICATDEHGTPAELAAKEQGVPVDAFCTEAHHQQKAIYDGFSLAFDYFGRSSSPQNHEITQEIARELKANGFIEERAIRQVYSNADGRFLPDRYIIGTCPHCGYDKARGDQCENCTRVLDPTDLIDARSAISGSSDLEIRETKHLFLLQSALAGEVEAWVDERADNWPVLASSIARKWLTEGLHDRAITRDLDWGVPVPADTWPDLAAEGKVFYVWFDAPIEYIGATKEWADQDPANRDWRSWWWKSDANVHYTQFMGKDNVPFHSVMFPATLLGTRAPWKKVDVIKAFNWLNYYGGKFSTSQRRGVFTHDALDILPADYWRYFMMANAPESDDSSFTWEHFTATVNKDLADTLGNFVNRVLSFSRKRFGEEVPAGAEPGEAEAKLGEEIARLLAEYESQMEAIQFRKAAAALRALWSAGNSYLEEKAPWLEIKTNPEGAALTLRTAMNLIHLYAVVSEPFIPTSAKKMREAFSLKDDTALWVTADEARSLTAVPAGTPFTIPPVLFAKLTDEDLESYKERFGGEPAA
ncbi:methionine--tRNA ligase [Streptomyces qaidamensis]|uniref:Methionine--tRNA ligase n=1 Tax=Streptomyces qaidamensis TaxID=1783515 RepID=A0A143C3I8_9ACTN|nr:methionine--tRNA ligase [Streptomyces qaidamensis]AMW11740.1 methionine--tRNA ligase [Streptomyces qaidamensis]